MSTYKEEQTETAAIVKPRRKYKLEPTPRQRRAARLIVDAAMGKYDAKSGKEIVAASGFGTGLQSQPKRVLNSVGVQDALQDYGFNENTAKKVVESILSSDKAAHKDRLKAADMVFKVHGTYAAEKHVSLNIDSTVDNERIIELANRLRNA